MLLDGVLFLVALAGCVVAGYGGMRLWQGLKGLTMSPLPVPDQALFFVGALVFGAATGARLWLREKK